MTVGLTLNDSPVSNSSLLNTRGSVGTLSNSSSLSLSLSWWEQIKQANYYSHTILTLAPFPCKTHSHSPRADSHATHPGLIPMPLTLG